MPSNGGKQLRIGRSSPTVGAVATTQTRLSAPDLVLRGRRAIDRYGWSGLSQKILMRAVCPVLAPVAALQLRHRAATTRAAVELVDLTFDFEAFGTYGIRVRPYQSRWEMARLLDEVGRLRPRTMLEIGTANGGSLFALARYCAPDARIISVDLPNGKFGGGYPAWKIPLYKSFAGRGQRLDLIRADSHSPETLEMVKGRLHGELLDFMFIDGDHTYEGVRRDLELYEQLVRPGGIIAFHDIVPLEGDFAKGINDPGDVPRFWAELKGGRDCTELIDPEGRGGFGIGLITVY
jgi:cephalosporin hydroxylase